ncbi:hypothetical protein PFLUV_G00017350 [Perca fluviatilis]|uniref:C2H2-type domain-containing protein n=1 Tax=Perca fluviatilis TaxID=8168 RepID=A0A6A5FP46_PERFL|nr:hypothetical protein PFLUV_G00017350 [Perca fluviatilis]
MSEKLVFYSETKSIMETVVKTALVVGNSKEQSTKTPNVSREPDFDSLVEMLTREATRKISAVFSELSSMLHNENHTLKIKVWHLESVLKTMTENFENARRWRENVLNGCPVLLEQSGLIYTLKPFGKLKRKTDTLPEGVAQTAPAAEMESGHDADGGEATKEVNSEAESSSASKKDTADDCTTTNTAESKNADRQNTQEAEVTRKGKLFVCHMCNKSFNRQFHLTKHMNTHKDQRPFACDQCPRKFRDTATFEYHLLRHEEKKYATFKCQLCEKTFKTKMCLKTHQLAHTDTRPFTCSTCGKAFKTKNNLQAHQRHQKATHDERHGQVVRRRTRERGNRRVIYRRDKTIVDVTPFSCKTCRKSFDSASVLRRHELIHAGQTQYNCDACGRSFFYKVTFDYHRRIHSGERPFGCDVCGKRFIIHQALKSHQLQHTGEKPHKCEHCGKAFRLYANYLRHLRVHTGEKPYECEVCGVRFRQLGHVKFHMQVHTGERPYSCSSCGLGFSDSRLLKKHNCAEKRRTLLGNTLSTP